jgi:hypothetical protein
VGALNDKTDQKPYGVPSVRFFFIFHLYGIMFWSSRSDN